MCRVADRRYNGEGPQKGDNDRRERFRNSNLKDCILTGCICTLEGTFRIGISCIYEPNPKILI